VPSRAALFPHLIAATVVFATACGDRSPSTEVQATHGLVSIASISPDTLRAGGQVTVTGSGFSTALLADTLLVDGVAANVVSASGTELRAILPTALPCAPPHLAVVSARAGGGEATSHQPIHAGVPRALAVGQTLLLDRSEVACNDLPGAGAGYLINVYSTITLPVQGAGFVATGSNGGAPTSSITDARRVSPTVPASPFDPFRQSWLQLRATRHADMLARNAAFLRAHGRAFASRTSRAPAPLPAVGSIRSLALPIPSCSTPTIITARVAAVSRRAIVYEDTAQGWGSRLDSTFSQIGQIFDTEIYPSDSANFADPLITDSLTDHDGRIGLVFSERVNLAGDQGLFNPCDLLPPTPTEASNFGEYVYVGLLPSSFPNGATAVMQEEPMVLAHETKHLASFAWRALHHAPPDAQWVEEGMAVLAEEVWARDHVYRVPWKGNTGYDGSMFCDLHLTDSRCRGTDGITDEVYLLYHFLDSTSTRSPFGSAGPGDFSFYDSGWSFMRWAVDRYAATESATLRAMTQSQSLGGVAHIAAVIGRPADEMIGNWSLALILDDDPSMAATPDANVASWNVYDILSGVRRDAAGIPALAAFFAKLPQAPVVETEASDFTLAHAGLFGGGFLPIRVTTSSAPTFSIGLAGATESSQAPAELRIAIARVH
jgi:IPT/TIG domain-containing protein